MTTEIKLQNLRMDTDYLSARVHELEQNIFDIQREQLHERQMNTLTTNGVSLRYLPLFESISEKNTDLCLEYGSEERSKGYWKGRIDADNLDKPRVVAVAAFAFLLGVLALHIVQVLT